MNEISLAHTTLSDNYLRDALNDIQSERGRVDCAIDSGYAALLSVLTPAERCVADHPNLGAASIAAKRLGIDEAEVARLLHSRYSLEGRPELVGALTWAEDVRASTRIFQKR